MKIEPITKQGYELLHDGAVELSRIEANGIRIDVPYLKKTRSQLRSSLRSIRDELQRDPVWSKWRRRFGANASLTSGDQLREVLFQILGHTPTAYTPTGKPTCDDEALQAIDNPFVQKYARFLKYDKAYGTFLKGIAHETVNGRLHPVFNLHTARTYRSSSDSPNFQNFPVRDKEIAKLVRRCFIASPGSVLVENDFKGVEVSVSACYHKDENFISYITTPGKDMHRDMAAQIYCLDPSHVSKEARYGAKNKFVFPQFYGDFYVTCAKALWEWIAGGKLTNGEGTPLYEHLKDHGIERLGPCNIGESPLPGTFEKHIQEVENDFWNNRFMGYGRWRQEWYQSYLKKGYFDILSGFRVHGSFKRNSVVNYPVQGAAFHCLLWSLIRVNRLLRKYKMRSKIVGQIHDSIIGDVKIKELRDYLEIVEQVTTVDVVNHFKWLIIPLVIEYEIAPSEGSWYDKREVHFEKGVFTHPSIPDKKTKNPEAFVRALNAMMK